MWCAICRNWCAETKKVCSFQRISVQFVCNFDHEKAEVVENQRLPLKKGVQDESRTHLTSSTRTPKFVGEEFCDTLVTFHGHGFGKSLAAFGQSEDDCGDCLGHVEHLVDAHADVGRL